MARLVREELGKCYRREGVNHLEKCGRLRGEFMMAGLGFWWLEGWGGEGRGRGGRRKGGWEGRGLSGEWGQGTGERRGVGRGE